MIMGLYYSSRICIIMSDNYFVSEAYLQITRRRRFLNNKLLNKAPSSWGVPHFQLPDMLLKKRSAVFDHNLRRYLKLQPQRDQYARSISAYSNRVEKKGSCIFNNRVAKCGNSSLHQDDKHNNRLTRITSVIVSPAKISSRILVPKKKTLDTELPTKNNHPKFYVYLRPKTCSSTPFFVPLE
jgi:hypothetical protein